MNLFNPTEIKSLLQRHNFNFNKSLGQNFLVDGSVCYAISEKSIKGDHFGVLEIGAGVGSFTRVLAESAEKVVAIELDRRLIPILGETLSDFENTKVICGDVLKLDLEQIIKENFDGMTPIVCANLPYYITTKILKKILPMGLFESISVMMQKEVADRICADNLEGDYGALSIFCDYYAKAEALFDIPPEAFIPPPKVTSSVVQFTRRARPKIVPKSEKVFFRVVSASFAQRRKTLLNGLSSGFSEIPKKKIEQILKECGFSPSVRGEQLSIEDFCKIADYIMKDA